MTKGGNQFIDDGKRNTNRSVNGEKKYDHWNTFYKNVLMQNHAKKKWNFKIKTSNKNKICFLQNKIRVNI